LLPSVTEGLPPADGKTEVFLPQLELALCAAGEFHPISTFQVNYAYRTLERMSSLKISSKIVVKNNYSSNENR
jgi:hypothetical protein